MGGLPHRAETPFLPALPTADGACLLPLAREALALGRHCLKSQADFRRARTRADLHTLGLGSPMLLPTPFYLPTPTLSAGGWMWGNFSTWTTGCSASSAHSEPRTNSAGVGFSQALSSWGLVLCLLDVQTTPLDYVRAWGFLLVFRLSPGKAPRSWGRSEGLAQS